MWCPTVDIMRTTVSVDDNLLSEARHRARLRGQTLGAYIEDALREQFARPDREAVQIPVVTGSGGLRPGVNTTSNRELQELLDEGIGLDALR